MEVNVIRPDIEIHDVPLEKITYDGNKHQFFVEFDDKTGGRYEVNFICCESFRVSRKDLFDSSFLKGIEKSGMMYKLIGSKWHSELRDKYREKHDGREMTQNFHYVMFLGNTVIEIIALGYLMKKFGEQIHPAKFTAKIVEIESFRDDRGHLFEQLILVEAETGEQFEIQDIDLLCNEEMEGKVVDFELAVFRSFSGNNICKQEGKEKKIVIPKHYEGSNRSIGNPTFYGEIIGRKYEHDPSDLIVDVGVGTILFRIDIEELDKYLIGDYIKIDSFMIQSYEPDF
ncbi:hypothetical protein [Methanococcus maripaludis]|uniref:Uncharacterized protein n=1 Tax=Methanococcus maripaludis TaxID=39152 RepID=A0A8T4CNP3_METMI|nr:hypothetical protein [Methanococcus maripaludis]MBM7408386.1 hypothetical protein [Methanococcus maripaludis]MBP2220056.1 hypothetical protein [Methanococcus maripaludis]